VESKDTNRPFLMRVHPLWLRERLFWKFFFKGASSSRRLFENAALEFTPAVQLKLLPSDIGHQQIAFMGFCELPESEKIHALAVTGGLLIDVGANYGYYSCLWLACKEDNKVIAFEPSPSNMKPLKYNLQLNNFAERSTVHSVALGETTGSLPFTVGPEDQSGWGGLQISADASTIAVPVDTLDNLMAGSQEQIQLLKIDTEGADTWVIKGARNLLASGRINHVIFEENEERMRLLNISSGQAQDILKDANYRLERISAMSWWAELRR
jgi:FkbM family methyltransferase